MSSRPDLGRARSEGIKSISQAFPDRLVRISFTHIHQHSRRSLAGRAGMVAQSGASRKANAKRERRCLRTMGFAVFFVAASIGAVAAISAALRTALSSPVADHSASAAPPNATGTIVLHPGAGCQSKIFDNRTSQIFDTGAPCPPETPRDAKGVPIPLGTAKTINFDQQVI